MNDEEYVPLFDPYAESEKKPKKKFVQYPKDENGNTIWPKQKQRGPRKNPYIKHDDEGNLIPPTDKEREKLATSAMNSCLWHLNQSPKTRQELKEKLKLKEIPDDIIEETLDRMEELKYLNDEMYTEIFVRNKQDFRSLGKGAIRQELRRKGVEAEIIETALEEVDEDDERERARNLVLKKMRSTTRLDRKKRSDRLVGMLMRKGYGGNIVFSVVKECLDEEEQGLLDPNEFQVEDVEGDDD